MANVLHMTKYKKQYIYTTVLKFGFGKNFYAKFLMLTVATFDQKYSKSHNVVKNHYHLKKKNSVLKV